MYIVFEIQTNADHSVGTLVTTYADKNAAESAFHQVLASAAVSALPVHTCMLLTENGICERSECYKHGEIAPEE